MEQQTKKIVSLKEFADGIYFVTIKSAENATTMKIVKK